MIPPPPRSTLFPYTTLFRSQLAHKLKNEYYGDYAAELALMSAELVTKNSKEIIERSKEGVRTVDRKSTRLNSSHEWISYAVFCLKKKKKKRNRKISYYK